MLRAVPVVGGLVCGAQCGGVDVRMSVSHFCYIWDLTRGDVFI